MQITAQWCWKTPRTGLTSLWLRCLKHSLTLYVSYFCLYINYTLLITISKYSAEESINQKNMRFLFDFCTLIQLWYYVLSRIYLHIKLGGREHLFSNVQRPNGTGVTTKAKSRQKGQLSLASIGNKR